MVHTAKKFQEFYVMNALTVMFVNDSQKTKRMGYVEIAGAYFRREQKKYSLLP